MVSLHFIPPKKSPLAMKELEMNLAFLRERRGGVFSFVLIYAPNKVDYKEQKENSLQANKPQKGILISVRLALVLVVYRGGC